jgi:hypothetical protein
LSWVVIVEGDGDERGVPVLTARYAQRRVKCVPLGGKSNIVRRDGGFEKTVLRQRELGATRCAVLLDTDQFFPPYRNLQEEQRGMRERAARVAKETGIAVEVFWAVKAFESWLIGGLAQAGGKCGLRRKIGAIPSNTETQPEQPKIWLKKQMLRPGDYSPRTIECLAKVCDLSEAQQRNASLVTFFKGMK